MLAQLLAGFIIIGIAIFIAVPFISQQTNMMIEQIQTNSMNVSSPYLIGDETTTITLLRWAPYIFAIFIALIGLKIFRNLLRDTGWSNNEDYNYSPPELTPKEKRKTEQKKEMEKYEYDSDTSTPFDEEAYQQKKLSYEETMAKFKEKKSLTEKELEVNI